MCNCNFQIRVHFLFVHELGHVAILLLQPRHFLKALSHSDTCDLALGRQCSRLLWEATAFLFPLQLFQHHSLSQYGHPLMGIRATWVFISNPVTCTLKWLWPSPSDCLAIGLPLSSVEKETKKCTMLKWLGEKPQTGTPFSPAPCRK